MCCGFTEKISIIIFFVRNFRASARFLSDVFLLRRNTSGLLRGKNITQSSAAGGVWRCTSLPMRPARPLQRRVSPFFHTQVYNSVFGISLSYDSIVQHFSHIAAILRRQIIFYLSYFGKNLIFYHYIMTFLKILRECRSQEVRTPRTCRHFQEPLSFPHWQYVCNSM